MDGGDGPGDSDEVRILAELLDRAMTALVAADAGGSVTHWNRYAEQLYGWTCAEALGRRSFDLLVGHADVELVASIDDVVRAGQSWQGEILAQRQDGSTVPVYLGSSPIHSADGSFAGMVSVAVDLTDRMTLEEQLEHRALHDPLTGLPNRVLFLDRLAHAVLQADRRRGAVALLFVDLDRFKLVNDGLGHEAGDRVLVAAALRLTECLRAGDTVARFGGDEFTVLLEEASAHEAELLADRILEAMRPPFSVDGHAFFVGATIGIAVGSAGPIHPGDLLRHADVAMYRAKAAGKGGIGLYEPGMEDLALARLDREADLRRAVEREELRLQYQPIVDLEDGRVVGLEALVRWEHPRDGRILPDEFVPLAEETGLILPIGEWVLAEACRQAQAWSASRPHGTPAVVGVNLSARQFLQSGMVQRVRDTLRSNGLVPGQLRLEITERVMLDGADLVLDALAALRAEGVGLEVDDFGTGYSSLGYLGRMPIDAIKIDRRFVAGFGRDPKCLAIARAIATLAHDLKMSVTAEGIETPLHLAYARAIGCDRGQGALFAPPLSPEDAGALLARDEPFGLPGGMHGDVRARLGPEWDQHLAAPLGSLIEYAEHLGLRWSAERVPSAVHVVGAASGMSRSQD